MDGDFEGVRNGFGWGKGFGGWESEIGRIWVEIGVGNWGNRGFSDGVFFF